jgi:uncharacterized protein YkwD
MQTILQQNERLDLITAELVQLHNQHRADIGRQLLTPADALFMTAEEKAWDMADHSYFDHISPRLGHLGNQLDAIGYRYIAWAENIGRFSDILSPRPCSKHSWTLPPTVRRSRTRSTKRSASAWQKVGI